MNDPPETTNAEMLSALTNAMTQFASAREPRKSLGDCRKAATSLELKFTGLPIAKRGSMWRDFEKKLFGLGNEFKWMKPMFKKVQGKDLDEGETIDQEDDELLVALLKYVIHAPALDKLTLAEDRDRAAGLPPSAISLLIEVQKWALPKTRGDMWQNIVSGLSADSMPSKADPTTYLANMNQNMENLKSEYGLKIPAEICVAFTMITLPPSYTQMHYDIAKQPSSVPYTFDQLSVDIQSHWASFLKDSTRLKDTETPDASNTDMGKMLAALDELQKKVDSFPDKGRPKTDPRLSAARRKQMADQRAAKEGDGPLNFKKKRGLKECDNCGKMGHEKATCYSKGGGQERTKTEKGLAINQVHQPDQNEGEYFGLAAVTCDTDQAIKKPAAASAIETAANIAFALAHSLQASINGEAAIPRRLTLMSNVLYNSLGSDPMLNDGQLPTVTGTDGPHQLTLAPLDSALRHIQTRVIQGETPTPTDLLMAEQADDLQFGPLAGFWQTSDNQTFRDIVQQNYQQKVDDITARQQADISFLHQAAAHGVTASADHSQVIYARPPAPEPLEQPATLLSAGDTLTLQIIVDNLLPNMPASPPGSVSDLMRLADGSRTVSERGDSPSPSATRSGTTQLTLTLTRQQPNVAMMSNLSISDTTREMYGKFGDCHEAIHLALAGQLAATPTMEPTVRNREIDPRATALAVEFQKVSPPNAIWDTGASMHMFTDRNYFSDFNASNTNAWHTAGDGVVRSSGTGTVPYRFYNQASGEYATIELRASLMEQSSFNLISAGLLEDKNGLYASIDKKGGMLFHDDEHTQVNLRKVDGVYRVTEHGPGDLTHDDPL